MNDGFVLHFIKPLLRERDKRQTNLESLWKARGFILVLLGNKSSKFINTLNHGCKVLFSKTDKEVLRIAVETEDSGKNKCSN